jgi:hypothetical protein
MGPIETRAQAEPGKSDSAQLGAACMGDVARRSVQEDLKG